MSSNYWESTQRRHWLFTKDHLEALRHRHAEDYADLYRMFPLTSTQHLFMYFNQQLIRLSKRLPIRQQCIATAQVYMKRFYTRNEIRRTNPYLIMTTAIYLACKMEESPQHIRLIVTEARALWSDYIRLEISKVGECEFFLIRELSCQLVVHQPYRTLLSLRTELPMTEEDAALARTIINDSFMTDLPLMYPPHIIALVAILLALVLRPNATGLAQAISNPAVIASILVAQAALSQTVQGRPMVGFHELPLMITAKQERRIARVHHFAAWLSESGVDVPSMVDVTQELIAFYESWETYNDKLTRDQMNRFIKARSLEK